MRKTFLTLFFLSAFFIFGKTELAWADPAGCTGALGCVPNTECKTIASENPSDYCNAQTAGNVCCQEKKSTSVATPTPTSNPTGSGTGIQVPTGTGLPSGDIISVLQKVLDWLEGVFLTLSLIAFVIVGLMYLFSLGNANSSAHTNAKAYLNQAITALLIVGGSYILIMTIDLLLRG